MCPIGRHGADSLGLGLHNGIRDDAFGCSSLLRKLRLSALPSVFALLLGSWFSGAATYMSVVARLSLLSVYLECMQALQCITKSLY